MHEPVGVELSRQRGLALEDRPPRVGAVARMRLDADEISSSELPDDGYGVVAGVVVDNVGVNAVVSEVIEACADKTLFVEGGQERDDAHGVSGGWDDERKEPPPSSLAETGRRPVPVVIG